MVFSLADTGKCLSNVITYLQHDVLQPQFTGRSTLRGLLLSYENELYQWMNISHRRVKKLERAGQYI